MRLLPAVSLFVGITSVAAAPARCNKPPKASTTAAGSSVITSVVPLGTAVPSGPQSTVTIPIGVVPSSARPSASTAAIPSLSAAGSGSSLEVNIALATSNIPSSSVAAPNASASANVDTTPGSVKVSGTGPLFDTAQSIVERSKALANMSEADIFAAIGQPTLAGDAQYHPLLREALANTTRLSVMHAQQVRDIISWKVPISATPASDASRYIGGEVIFLLSMIQDFSETVITHELAHAVFDHQGFLNSTEEAVKVANLDESYGDVGSMINEGFATIWANHALVYMDPSNVDRYDAAEWEKRTQKTTAEALDWILDGDDGTAKAWQESLAVSKVTVDKKGQIIAVADGVIFPKLGELYSLDQARGV
ncbi:hypothetical protein CcaverHIS002_0602370 [Cutaneotrichosporon cavernicola]|uniref:Peptidase M48 domain-containing protein n=1 Tax=Cutaneotrichosporon cavernicola TaxID=279322 RepID=A0AA48L885_9TREE|nr:uncharacterized protein CcaverHIS019_0601860 [Cutaneotrichosporon cavernicola]BEI85950.1 hypothetical protein CcaverHIS002_0602370 [Cutaneotrichosporon cavernicola]BEI93727.1 hypothetical protein CcaverHIS019_0601860 [Cutaneotrichosporon cavernicola]BEJ01505.1 hypothetical protein CcaverHIS631_0601870 [Cutaneotrichosporon cavernicola]BEJ09270.1 hypothetical protein CcaverHIS641_0601850 [Cutaneotrichosporon cavernicola]